MLTWSTLVKPFPTCNFLWISRCSHLFLWSCDDRTWNFRWNFDAYQHVRRPGSGARISRIQHQYSESLSACSSPQGLHQRCSTRGSCRQQVGGCPENLQGALETLSRLRTYRVGPKIPQWLIKKLIVLNRVKTCQRSEIFRQILNQTSTAIS